MDEFDMNERGVIEVRSASVRSCMMASTVRKSARGAIQAGGPKGVILLIDAANNSGDRRNPEILLRQTRFNRGGID
jgi:hypothetical protein